MVAFSGKSSIIQVRKPIAVELASCLRSLQMNDKLIKTPSAFRLCSTIHVLKIRTEHIYAYNLIRILALDRARGRIILNCQNRESNLKDTILRNLR